VNDAIDITTAQRKTVLDLLSRHLPDTEVWVYGSRANWTSKPHSDLDMVVFTTPDQSSKVADLKEAFEESDLPFRVDLFVWDEIPDSFKRNIEAEHVVLQHGGDGPSLYKPNFPPNWDRHSLHDLADWINGLAFRNVHFSPTGKPVVKIAEIKNGLSGQTKYTQAEYDKRYRLVPGDMLFCWSGQPETSIDTFWWRGPEGWLNQHIFKVLPKDICDNTFFFYLLKYLKPHFIRIAHNKQTTGLGHVTKADLQRMEVAVPKSKKEQKAIAHILGTLDDKIELNRRMNETLEGIARAIFKSWFIDFDPVRRNAARDQNQPSPPAPLPCFAPSPPPLPVGEVPGEGGKRGNYRGGYDFAGLVEKAREMRKKQTPAEDMFWELVRNRRFMDLKFRRQHQFGDYVADFYCHEHRLVIELDGGVHDAQHKKDHKRDAWMKAQGYTVLRFKNEQLLDDPEVVFMRIAASLPLPLGEGRGEGMVESTAFDHLFPDGFEDSVLGEIPKGWKVGKIGDALELAYGKSLAKKTRTSGQFPVYGSGGVSGSHNECLVTGPGIVVGRKGTVGSVYWVDTDFFPIDTVFYVKPRKGYSLRWIYGALQYVDVAHLAADSAVPGVNRNSVYEQKFLLPPIEATAAYEKLTCAFIGYCRSLTLENEKIQSTRDHLLPALLSGRLAVPDLQQKLGRAL
jgi:type I restriction enzyme, S subunit